MVEQTKSRGVGEIGRARASVTAIETLATIRRQARTVASDGERVALSGWSGWGPLAKAFAPTDGTWAELSERVQRALPESDVTLGLKGTYMAFYTPEILAAAIWDMLRGFGYDGGPVAELGCGGGVFFKTAPQGVPLVGVERDPTAAAICELMHPNVKVINKPLEETHLPATFAAVVGNVPFGEVEVFDPQAPEDVTGSLHNYFVWRAIQALAPGGYAILITSRFSMDGWQAGPREQLSKEADFVGALRLPNGALGGGTEATADVLILRRKGGHKLDTYPHEWRKAVASPWDATTRINEWWVDRPEMVLGTMKKGKTNQYGLGLVVEADGRDLDADMVHLGRMLADEATGRNLGWTAPPDPASFDAVEAGVVSAEGWIDGSMRLSPTGGVLVVKNGKAQPLPRPGQELMRLLRLRDLAVELIRAEADYSRPDHTIEPIRADVRNAYQDYVKAHGPLNRYTQRPNGFDPETGEQQWSRRYPTMQGFRHDPDSALVFALEMFADDDDGDTDEEDAGMRATPAPIQTARQNVPPRRQQRTGDPAQALAWCLDRQGGKVHIDYIAALLGRPILNDGGPSEERDRQRAEIAALLGDTVYLDPTSRTWQTAESYLSGDVRRKHRAAETAAKHDPQFRRNVEALEKALPPWLGPADITANLGAPWIGPADLQQFIREVIGFSATVKRAAGQWEVEAQGALRNSVAASVQWGTPEKDAFELLQLALNGKIPTVTRTVYDAEGNEKQVKDHEKSMLAAEKQQEIRARFSEWVWEDPHRAKRLEHHYNWTYNNLRARQFDGSHITIEGIAPWFDPYAHQASIVARGMVTPAVLCGHPVGAGKTNSMGMLAMKLKQVGLANKPMIIVPNHLLEQIDRELRQLFPAAKILSGSSKTIAANRMAFTARCATGDWDIVLVTHSAFNSMNVAPETQARYFEDLEAELRDGVTESAGGQLKGRMVKQLAKALDRMRGKVRELRHTKRARDAGVLFEQLGVDYILVDEFHYYKNLALPVRTEGFSVRPSKRASDLDMKIRYLRERNGGGPHAALFSGTPVSNTMLELYVCLHYTMRPYLKEIGLGTADEWAAAFVQFVTNVEVTVDGGDFQMRTRPSLFVNAPELRVLLAESADIRTAEQLGLKRPAADLHIVACEPTETQSWFSSLLVERAEDVRNKKVEPDQDNMLKICTDGRRMATDPALVGLDDDGEYKLHVAARKILEFWKQHPGKLQMAFLDIGTPRRLKGSTVTDYQSYGRLRRMLTDAGMDVSRIRFIHDAKDDAAKARLFRDCRRGKVDVIIGSTDKLGVGTNVQKLIVAMHHIDAPFRPADVEQRDGRGLRPGNIHKVVSILRYVTKRTFDAYMWQMLTRKLTFIGQMLSGNLDRTVEDVTGDDVLSFSAIKAAATDQPLLQEKAAVEAELKKLTLKERSHRQTVARMRRTAPELRDLARIEGAKAAAWEAVAAVADTVDLDDDDVIALIAERMERFAYYGEPIRVGKLEITWRAWRTRGENAENQPLLGLNGGAGRVEEKGYKFWKAAEIRRRMRKLLGGAAEAAKVHRKAEAEALSRADDCEAAAGQVFPQAAELIAAKAKLEHIEAQLREAASEKDTPPDAVAVEAEEFDLDELAEFASGFLSDLEDEVAQGLADLFGDALA